ncbi:MAG: methyltransferase [Elainella sp.]
MTLDTPLPHLSKSQIAARFGQAAPAYHTHAKLQQACAAQLVALLLKYRDALPAGPVLEIGCGTGFITQLLLDQLSARQLEITDLSADMLQFCQAHLAIPDPLAVKFAQLDAEHIGESYQNYATIVGGFVLQWFHKPDQIILHLVNRLHPDGLLALSFPTCQSFPEWRQICQQISLPYTANPLPDPVRLANLLTASHLQLLETVTLDQSTSHRGAASFFRDLKTIGANTAHQRLSPQQLRRLIQTWDEQTGSQTEVHYQIALWLIRRRG